MIVIDSFTQDKEDDSTTDVEWEDFDDVGLVLPGQKGKRTITMQSNDLSHAQLSYLLGETVGTGTDAGFNVEGLAFEMPTQALQIITRPIDIYPAKQIEYARLKVEVKESGTLGKNQLPNLTLTMTKLANMDSSGVQIPGKRWKDIP
jgi:hypothetical protein